MQCALLSYQHLLSLGLLLTISVSGCSWQHPAQKNLPGADSHRDEIPFFPAGPEDKLFNQRRAIEEYKAAQAAADAAQADGETSPE
jgi:hypothetical protein